MSRTQHPWPMGLAAIACGVVTWATTLGCQANELTRYRAAGGVEMIMGRQGPAQGHQASVVNARGIPTNAQGSRNNGHFNAPTSRTSSALTHTGAARPGTGTLPSQATPHVHVAPDDQRRRDRDRLTILTAELISEGQALHLLQHQLKSPQHRAQLSAVELQSANERLARHEVNIRSINEEVQRAERSLRNRH